MTADFDSGTDPFGDIEANFVKRIGDVKILYVRNLMLETTEDTLERLFTEAVTGKTSTAHVAGGQPNEPVIERVKKIRDYAFVHFRDREEALIAMERMNGADIDGSTIEVVLAKPADKSRQRQSRSKPVNDVTQVSGIPVFAAVGGSLVPTQMAAVPAANSVLLTANRELQQSNRTQTASLKSRSSIGANVTSSCRNSFLPYKKPLSVAEGRLCNYIMPAVEVIYANPPMLVQQPVLQSPVQILEDLCLTNGFGSPLYHLFAGVNEGMQMYTSKLTVAGKEFFVNSMSPSVEEAQTSVAMLALKTLTEVSIGNIPPSVISPPVQWSASSGMMQSAVYACPVSPSSTMAASSSVPLAHVPGSIPAAGVATQYHLFASAAAAGAMAPGTAVLSDPSGLTGGGQLVVGQPGLQFVTADRNASAAAGQLQATYLPTIASYGI